MWSEEADIGMFYDEVKIGDGQTLSTVSFVLALHDGCQPDYGWTVKFLGFVKYLFVTFMWKHVRTYVRTYVRTCVRAYGYLRA